MVARQYTGTTVKTFKLTEYRTEQVYYTSPQSLPFLQHNKSSFFVVLFKQQ